MRIRIEFAHASVFYEDNVKHPTPEHAEDTLIRLERALKRTWEGKTLEPADLSAYEDDERA